MFASVTVTSGNSRFGPRCRCGGYRNDDRGRPLGASWISLGPSLKSFPRGYFWLFSGLLSDESPGSVRVVDQELTFRLFGPLQVITGERPVELGPRKQRAILAMLLMQPGRVLPMDRLIAQLWADRPPASAVPTVQGYVSHLRRALPDRNLLVLADEPTFANCSEGLRYIWMFDVREPANPVSIATFPQPAEADYCAKGGSFGPHNLHENRPGSLQSSRLIFATYYNAGVRAYDIANPFQPREIAYYVPANPTRMLDPRPNRPQVIQSCDCYVDPNGLMNPGVLIDPAGKKVGVRGAMAGV